MMEDLLFCRLMCLFICVCVCICVHLLSCAQLFVTPQNTAVGCHFLLQGILLIQGSNACLLCLLHLQADSLPIRSHRQFPPHPPVFVREHLEILSVPPATVLRNDLIMSLILSKSLYIKYHTVQHRKKNKDARKWNQAKLSRYEIAPPWLFYHFLQDFHCRKFHCRKSIWDMYK